MVGLLDFMAQGLISDILRHKTRGNGNVLIRANSNMCRFSELSSMYNVIG